MHRYYRADPSNPGFNLRSSQDSKEYHYEWTCWEKFHTYYFPRGLFNAEGNVIITSPMNQERKIESERRDALQNELPAMSEEQHEEEQEQEQHEEEEGQEQHEEEEEHEQEQEQHEEEEEQEQHEEEEEQEQHEEV